MTITQFNICKNNLFVNNTCICTPWVLLLIHKGKQPINWLEVEYGLEINPMKLGGQEKMKKTFNVYYLTSKNKYSRFVVETTSEKRAITLAKKELNCEQFGKIKVLSVEVVA